MGEAVPAESASTLRHESRPYSGPSDLVPTASTLISAGLQDGAACLFAAAAPKIDAVREELGNAAEQTTFLDTSVQGRNPARVLPVLQSFVDAHPQQQLQVVAEPVHSDLTAPARAEAAFAELIFSLGTYRAWPATVTCLYDLATLDEFTTELIRSAHRDEPAAPDAEARLSEQFAEPLPPAPPNARRINADMTTLGELRGNVNSFAVGAGLDDERIDDLVYAVNEVVTNSICHGEGRARVQIWTDVQTVTCEVFDRGRITDPLVGRIAPRSGQLSGRGLWLVNQLCDLVQVRSSAAGTYVRMSVDC